MLTDIQISQNACMKPISEIAEKAFVSTATISRAIKKCGIRNLHDVRYQLAVKQIAKKNVEQEESEIQKIIEEELKN